MSTDALRAEESDLESIDSEKEDQESTPPDYQIATYPADFTLEVLHQKWKANDIVVPEFQREFVWKQAQASKLIESFLAGLPVPAVFLYRERESRRHLVIDGQQRLKSVFFYFEGIFGEESREQLTVFKLKGLNEDSRFYDKTFEDLPEEDQRGFKDSVLRAFIVQQLDPNDDTSMYHIFERLNTGGTLLSPQEIRNCVYHGNFVDVLEEMNKLDGWRKIFGRSMPDSRKRDVELILRFFAMRELGNYKKPMKNFLSKFMNKNKNMTQENMAHNRKLFDRTCKAILDCIGERPFHIRSGLNAAVFDSVMVAFSRHLEEIPEDIDSRYKELIDKKEFDNNTRAGTTDVDVIQRRFRQAEQQLFGA